MDKKFSRWYRQRYERISAEPPEELWAQLGASLDKKRHRERKRLAAFLLSSAGMLLITGTLWLFAVESGINKGRPFSFTRPYNVTRTAGLLAANAQTRRPERSNSNLSEVEAKDARVGVSTTSLRPRSFINANASHFSAASARGAASTSLHPEKRSNLVNSVVNPGPGSENFENTLELYPAWAKLKTELSLAEFKGTIQPVILDSVKNTSSSNSFYLGLTANYHNTWVVNSNLWYAAQRNSLSYVVPYYSASGSLLAGYSLEPRKALFAEAGMYRLGQRYYSCQEGHLSQYELTLRYANLNLYASFDSKHRARTNIDSWFAIQAGMHAGYLLSASENSNSEAANIRDDYRKINVGLLLGLAYNALWKKHIGLSVGIRGQIGLLNVYSGNDELPLSLNKTFNESASLFTSLYYAF